ncbi:head completion/stabilization protein [Pseudomonas alkylphenolica]|uniref:head completion/stabilization protein n=1 Tax=Pseudomonas alkylphenolica TaxID=237609 RepID=UPI0018D8C314|nr:head completion/stabilization protein [Pseudomonas alkylphenolica]MBH3428262.1 head completion/stabilization protein [Pseudomonas alkylphenolica]
MPSKNDTTEPIRRRDLLVSDDPFWPSISLLRLRRQLLLPPSVSDARLEVAAQIAVRKAGGEFAQWRRVLRARGYKRLQDMKAHGPLSCCYVHAVEAYAIKALQYNVRVIERLRGLAGRQVDE